MNQHERDELKRSLLPSIAVLAFAVAYVVIGYFTLDETTRLVPLLTGLVTLLLVIIDIVRVVVRGGAQSGSWVVEGGGVKVPESRGREIAAILFVAGGVAAVYLLGFLVAIPLYLFASIAYLGRQSLRIAAAVALLTSLAIFLVFEVALDYQLYPGALFS